MGVPETERVGRLYQGLALRLGVFHHDGGTRGCDRRSRRQKRPRQLQAVSAPAVERQLRVLGRLGLGHRVDHIRGVGGDDVKLWRDFGAHKGVAQRLRVGRVSEQDPRRYPGKPGVFRRQVHRRF